MEAQDGGEPHSSTAVFSIDSQIKTEEDTRATELADADHQLNEGRRDHHAGNYDSMNSLDAGGYEETPEYSIEIQNENPTSGSQHTRSISNFEEGHIRVAVAVAILGIAFGLLTSKPPICDQDHVKKSEVFCLMDFLSGKLPQCFYLYLLVTASIVGSIIEIIKLIPSHTVSKYLLVAISCLVGALSILLNKQMVRFTIQVGSSSTQISSSTLLILAALSLTLLFYLAIKLCATIWLLLAEPFKTNLHRGKPCVTDDDLV